MNGYPAVLSDNSHSTILADKRLVINTEVVRVSRLNENSLGSEMETCDFTPKCFLENDGSCRNLISPMIESDLNPMIVADLNHPMVEYDLNLCMTKRDMNLHMTEIVLNPHMI